MLERTIHIAIPHRILFGRDVFGEGAGDLARLLDVDGEQSGMRKVLVCAEEAVLGANPDLSAAVSTFLEKQRGLEMAGPVVAIPGGESCKNDFGLVQNLWQKIDEGGIDRHSFVFAIGGGALLDLVSFAASTAHRGIRHVRFPTTTLSQGDGGVGVKNGVNYFGKKNWVGTFTIPYAVVNDFLFLESLPDRPKRDGIIEGIKVGLVRDAAFFEAIEKDADALAVYESAALERLVRRSAELHVEHIATAGDPFELGSARPLDFGHWVAHKLEQITDFSLTHGEAVGIGMAVDLLYSARAGITDSATVDRILALIDRLGFPLYHPALEDGRTLMDGLEEFREHLGGELTITLVPEIGTKREFHEMSPGHILAAIAELRERFGDGALIKPSA